MKNIDNSISGIRFISMILIISCHILQGLNNYWSIWTNIGVQIFFFVSGFLYGKRIVSDYKSFYIKRIKKILLPYIIVLIISLLLEYFVLNNHYPITKIIGYFMGFGAFIGNISILSHTWFVSYILLCYLLVPILQNVFSSDKYKNNFLFLILIMFFVLMFHIYNVTYIESSWINNFILGYFYGKCCTKRKQKRQFHRFVFSLFVLVMPIAFIYQEQISINIPIFLEPYSKIIINYGHVLLGTIVFLILYKNFNRIQIKNNKIFSFTDKYSYYIYLVHQIFILNSFSILFLTKNLFVNIILILFSSIISAIIIKKISDFVLVITEKIFYRLKK